MKKIYDYNLLSNLWKEGKTMSQIVEIYGNKICYGGLCSIIHRNRDLFPKRREYKEYHGKLKNRMYNYNLIFELYNNGDSRKKIVDKINMKNPNGLTPIIKIMKKFFDKKRKYDYKRIFNLFNKGFKSKEIAQKLDVKSKVIRDILYRINKCLKEI